jgi:glutamate-ammonia-ligase adenylyltransferase
VEHYLQILEDRQIHSLPTEDAELTALAKRMMGIHAHSDDFVQELERRMVEVRETYLKYLIKG